MLEVDQLAVELLGAARFFVGFSLFQLGDDFSLARFELLNLFLKLVDAVLLRLAFARASLALFSFETLLVFAGRGGRSRRLVIRRGP